MFFVPDGCLDAVFWAMLMFEVFPQHRFVKMPPPPLCVVCFWKWNQCLDFMSDQAQRGESSRWYHFYFAPKVIVLLKRSVAICSIASRAGMPYHNVDESGRGIGRKSFWITCLGSLYIQKYTYVYQLYSESCRCSRSQRSASSWQSGHCRVYSMRLGKLVNGGWPFIDVLKRVASKWEAILVRHHVHTIGEYGLDVVT